ncbi:hypothetical protein B0H14DRAFT_3886261 [Mycena olivaceomarginata]|nr:hypothetical protein B0H14DRAFT_3886261 [Mycena olivaceomarginata]
MALQTDSLKQKLYFAINSGVPGLEGIPPMKQQNIDRHSLSNIPNFLRLSAETRSAIELHIASVGIEVRRYDYGCRDQASALQFLAVMNIFIPGLDGQLPPKSQNDSDSDSDTATPSVPTSRDVQSKFAILRTSANVLTGAKVPVKRYKRITRFLQCQCGVDHTTGRFAKKGSAATRQIPWPDVGCLVFIKIVSLHDLQRDGQLIAIDHISGVLDHSPACEDIIEMSRNPRVGLHPELREYALSLLRKKAPISLIRSECATWAKEKWGSSPGDSSFRYILTPHDSTSLYRSYAAECNISQRSAAEDNLDRWFNSTSPQPPSADFSAALIHYQPHLPPATDRFVLILATPDMQAAAWQFGHNKLVIMDLTFNVCSARVLVTER